MSHYTCPHGERLALFGEGGGATIAAEFGVPLLGQIPFDPATLRGGDTGQPVVAALPGTDQAHAFVALAGRVAAQLSIQTLRTLPAIG
jgi:ATP-binding protein involved in chromosome partitioning